MPFLWRGTEEKATPTFHERVEYFQNMAKYLLRLRENGDITNDTFNYFIKKITADFVEAEISERINKVFNEKLQILTGRIFGRLN